MYSFRHLNFPKAQYYPPVVANIRHLLFINILLCQREDDGVFVEQFWRSLQLLSALVLRNEIEYTDISKAGLFHAENPLGACSSFVAETYQNQEDFLRLLSRNSDWFKRSVVSEQAPVIHHK